MQRIALALLVFAALVLAQSRTSITPLNPGQTVNGVITNIGVSDSNVAPVLYSIYIPENATVINFSLTNTNNDDCSYVDLLVETQVPPCVQGTYGIDTYNSFCTFFSYDYSGFSDAFLQMEPGTSSSWFVQAVDTYVFVGVATEGSYIGEACSYSLTVSFNFTCPSGSVGIRNTSNDNDAGCIFYHDVPNPSNFSVFVNVNQTENYFDEWRFPIEANTGAIHFHVDSSEYMYAYGRSNGGSSEDAYDCYQSSTSNDGLYYLDLHCYVPESGWFYLFLESSNAELNLTLSSTVDVCAAGTGGYNCSFASAQIADFDQVYSVKFDYQSGWLSYPFRYFYFDAPASLNSSNLVLNVKLENTTGSDEGYVIVTKNNFPEASTYRDSYQYGNLDNDETFTYLYTFYDAYYWPRNWIGLYCYDNTCNFTIWFTSPSTTTTTTTTSAAATSSSTTAAAATSTSTSTAAAATSTSTSTSAAAATSTSTSTSAAASTATSTATSAAAATSTTTTTTTTTSTSSTTGNGTATTTTSGPVTTLLFTTNSGSALVASLVLLIAAALL